MKAEKISVIIPTYNRSQKLKRSVESVLQQTYDNIELLIIDDSSEDNTEEMIESIKDNRIHYIKLAVNMGASYARNEGVRKARTSLIAFQDSDDIWKPDKLEHQMTYWQKHPEFSMIYCAFFRHSVGTGGLRMPPEELKGLEGKIFQKLLLRNTIGTPTMLMKKACFFEVGGFDITLSSLEDWDFSIRFSEKYTIGYLDEILVDVFETPGGVSSGRGAYYDSRCRMIANYKEQMVACGVLEQAIGDVFARAEKSGVLEKVKNMLLLYMEQKGSIV